MPTVTARAKVKGKEYEISVDLDEALKIKTDKGGDITRALNSNGVFHDLRKGDAVSSKDLMDAFGSTDLHTVALAIIKNGEVQKTQEFRDAEREARVKQVVQLILKNAVDQHGKPFTEDRLMRAVNEVHFSFDSRPAEKQMTDLLEKLKTVIPIKVEVKRVKLVVPARYTTAVYSLLKDYKESEEWLSNGDLETIISLPAGMQLDFYDKINKATHGAIVSQEIKE